MNTVGSYYCSCAPPLVLDSTQRNCVNSSDLNVGKTLSSSFASSSPRKLMHFELHVCRSPFFV